MVAGVYYPRQIPEIHVLIAARGKTTRQRGGDATRETAVVEGRSSKEKEGHIACCAVHTAQHSTLCALPLRAFAAIR
jgi:hypothetical protein